MNRLKLGISSCLLGQKVRYDGGHQRHSFLADTLGKYVQYVPVCPEVECGLPVPREPIRLVGDASAPRLLTVHTGRDLTAMMERWSQSRVAQLEADQIDGFVFKSRSPSCGTQCVKVYDEADVPSEQGRGIFAREFMRHFPLLVVEEDERLDDPPVRDRFIERLFRGRSAPSLMG